MQKSITKEDQTSNRGSDVPIDVDPPNVRGRRGSTDE